ncbi:MAG: thiamine pyrophosphate-dependent dehydrogenase E1 component subunit alpha [Alcaligenaceae bacterium]|nr:MAG: thiamine pyrophosphate-dependent dehydrogenase E1 component subunit alpha [Alcaligenaceae bacterium]
MNDIDLGTDLRANFEQQDHWPDLTTNHLEMLWRKAVLIRCFEDKIMELYMQGLVPGTTHLSHGHEGVSVGAISAIRPGDFVSATYRGHHHALSVGVEPYTLFAEMMGRVTGNCGGMGGSTHAATDFSRGLLGTSLIIGAGIPVAVGAALGARMRKRNSVALCFFGDGASNAGVFHEALNMASLWKAPTVFVIENNLYAEYTKYSDGTSVPDLAIRAVSYGMPSETVDGQDAVSVGAAVARAAGRARAGEGPTLIEAKTYRFSGHSRTDPGKYRPQGELARWRQSDPIEILAARLEAAGLMRSDAQESYRNRVVEALDEESTRASEDPTPTKQEAMSHVFA